MFHFTHYHFRRFERVVRGRIRLNPKGRLARLARSEILDFERGHLARGLAIGMFWAFLPIPFQMFPAALFCFFARGNLPLALVAVWISNPLTYAPIFYFEYQFGAFLLSESLPANGAQFEDGALFDSLAAFLTPDKIKILARRLARDFVLDDDFRLRRRLVFAPHRAPTDRSQSAQTRPPPCERGLRFAASPTPPTPKRQRRRGRTPSGFCFIRPRRLLFLCPPPKPSPARRRLSWI